MARGARDARADAERSFEQLYRGHRGEVYRAALRELGNVHDAEDVTQAAFVDAYRAVLRGTKPQAPRAWLLTIAENVRRRRFRTAHLRPREEPLDADAAIAAEESREQAAALLDALGSLTPEQRDAFLLREIAGLSYDEIAARTGSTVGSVQMLLFRARKSLREELEPPQVQPLLVPLLTLFSRAEHLGAAPRVAGAVGALALAVGVGSSVPAQAESPPPGHERTAVPAASAAAHARPSLVIARPAPARVVDAARQRQASRAAAPEPVVVPAPLEPSAGEASLPVAAPASAPSSPPVETPLAPAETPSVPSLTPDELMTEVSSLMVPVLVPAVPASAASVPALPLPEELLESAGAAGAAGADAPPLPELPLDALPPVP